jgi:hypothetical protein
MVRKLLSLGAIVDGYGKTKRAHLDGNDRSVFPERTPLQFAAETGHVAIVKILMGEYGADDSLIAPDGALALRLAAANGHREVVDYLPVRRGGAWKRWRYAHRVEMDRIRRALHKIGKFITFFIWHVPKFLLWTAPKEATKAAGRKLKSAWKRRREFGGWIKKQVVELPSRVGRVAKKVAKGVKKIPSLTKRIASYIWRFIKALPQGAKMCATWIGELLSKTGHWIALVVNRFASFLHTVFAAIASWFGRITIKDVWNGLTNALRALCIGLPKLLWSFVKSFAKFSYHTLEAVFGTLGLCLWLCVAGIIWLVCYIPKKLWQSFEALGRLVAKTWDEILVYFDPKKV